MYIIGKGQGGELKQNQEWGYRAHSGGHQKEEWENECPSGALGIKLRHNEKRGPRKQVEVSEGEFRIGR